VKTLFSTFACAVLLAGCSEDPKPTITQGVWGLIVAGCDTGGCDSNPIEGATVDAAPIMGTMGMGGSSKTDAEGMYQIELSPGQYQLTLVGMSVAETDVTIGTGLMECTWLSGPGGGNWTCR
jgi:hypothetical protein